ncbi:MAG: hypothetical protein PUB39_04045 [Eubacteriales bacterium]|nr:hypothetical protein [Eubacteriales bacterium]
MTKLRYINTYIRLKDNEYALSLAKGLARDGPDLRIFIAGPDEISDDEGDRDMDGVFIYDFNGKKIAGDSENDHSGDREVKPAHKILYLTDNDEAPANKRYVSRFKDTRALASMIEDIYLEDKEAPSVFKTGRIKLVTFTALGGGCGTTSAVVSAAETLAGIYGSRSLLVDMSMNGGLAKYLDIGGEHRVNELVYYVRKGRRIPLGTFIDSGDKFDYLAVPLGPELEVGDREQVLKALLNELDASSRYEFMIIDAGSFAYRELQGIIAGSACNVIVSAVDLEGLEHSRRAEDFIRSNSDEDKVVKIVEAAADGEYESGMAEDNRDHGRTAGLKGLSAVGEKKADYGAGLGRIYRIRTDKSAFARNQGKISIDLDGKYGSDISKVAMGIFDASFTGGDTELLQ